MRSFLKIFFASFLALILFTVIAVFLIVGIIAAAASSDKPQTGEKAVLVIDLTRELHEQGDDDPLSEFTGDPDNNLPGLYDVVQVIRYAKTDSKVKGIYLRCNDNVNGFASSQELRNAIVDFKSSKKFVIAYGDVISQKAYYVASASDKVYCNPKGTVDWRGFASTLMFLKGTLEKLDIQPQIFYAGKFKSATEPLREYEMTEANRLQTAVYLGDLYGNLLLAAAEHSKKDTAFLHQVANSGAIQTAGDALRYNLIDGTKYDDEVKGEISNLLKSDVADKINFITLGKYQKAADYQHAKSDRIAVVYAEGEIVDGKGGKDNIGSDEYKLLIRKLRLDKSVKAIVFRVNSPGGSALASEVILRELTLAKKVKPVVVSFGDVAASGGYYISTNADSIFAQPTTITGSIGVFGIMPNMQNFFKNKLGVTFDGVKTGPFADMLTVSRPLNDAEKKFIQNSIDTIYMVFKTHVAEGRKKTMEFVDSIAQGRVWTGQRALQIGLVDKLGNIQDALNCASRMAKLKEYSIKSYPEKKGFIESLIGDRKSDIQTKMIREEVGEEQYQVLMQLKKIRQMVAIPQARLPFSVTIQ